MNKKQRQAKYKNRKRNQKRDRTLHKKIGYALLVPYAITAIIVLIFSANLKMLPINYLAIIGVFLAIIGVILAIMHEKKGPSIVASIFSLVCVIGFVIISLNLRKTTDTIATISTADVRTDAISVYVMQDNVAHEIEEARDYTFGILTNMDRTNTNAAIERIETRLQKPLEIVEYENMFSLADDLQDQTIDAVIMNSAYVGIISDVEDYHWIATDIRSILYEEFHTEIEVVEAKVIEQDSFVMYLSGIDTYGSITTRSRSDVNILAVVNTRTKNILLLSTPRDAYLPFSVTGGAKDKLTHAGIYGVDASMSALEELYDVKINYYLRVNFQGFTDIINALGGIEVYSDYDFAVHNVRSYNVGMNQVNGIEALAFARERYSFAEGDAQRAKNQMEVIRALIAKAASPSILTSYGSVMNAVSGSFETSMPQEQIATLVKMQLSDMAQWTVTSFAPTGQSRRAETYSMPGTSLSVIELSEESVEEAKRQIGQVLAE